MLDKKDINGSFTINGATGSVVFTIIGKVLLLLVENG